MPRLPRYEMAGIQDNTVMSYTLSLDLPDGAFTVTDCVRSDQPRKGYIQKQALSSNKMDIKFPYSKGFSSFLSKIIELDYRKLEKQ